MTTNNEPYSSDVHRPGKKEAYFYYIAQRIESSKIVASGAEIKAMIKAVVPAFDPSHILVLEGQGQHGDRVIKDEEEVSLEVDSHEPAKHFFSKPPTNFGI
jgi:hypothetical protein